MVDVDRGTEANERTGRSILAKKISYRMVMSLQPGTGVVNQTQTIIRVILFQDRQANGDAADISDILQGSRVTSFRNLLEGSTRYRILSDKFVSLVCQAGGTPSMNTDWAWHSEFREVHLPINLTLEFGDGDPTTIGDLKSNNIGCWILSSQANTTSISVDFRLRFYDN